MNFKTHIDANKPACSISSTGDALGPNCYGSLKMARAALSDGVDALIAGLRDAKKAALKVKESDLSEDKKAEMPPARSAAE